MADSDGGASGDKSKASGGTLRSLQDPYERYARLAPALLTMLPVGIALVAFPTGDANWLKPIIGIVSACGGTLLLAAMARSAGRTVEETVFADGLPTLKRLRHREATTRAELAELHAVVERAADVSLPSADEEAADQQEADGAYRVAVSKLIAASRDQDRFGLLHKENRNYGFIRNLLGLASMGRVLSVIGLVAGIVLLVVALVRGVSLDIGLAAVAVVISTIGCYVFFAWLGPSRLSAPANAYADRLFEAARELGSG